MGRGDYTIRADQKERQRKLKRRVKRKAAQKRKERLEAKKGR